MAGAGIQRLNVPVSRGFRNGVACGGARFHSIRGGPKWLTRPPAFGPASHSVSDSAMSTRVFPTRRRVGRRRGASKLPSGAHKDGARSDGTRRTPGNPIFLTRGNGISWNARRGTLLTRYDKMQSECNSQDQKKASGCILNWTRSPRWKFWRTRYSGLGPRMSGGSMKLSAFFTLVWFCR